LLGTMATATRPLGVFLPEPDRARAINTSIIGQNVFGVADESNTIRIGNTDITDTFITGISGTTVGQWRGGLCRFKRPFRHGDFFKVLQGRDQAHE